MTHLNAMGSRKLIVLPERPAGELSIGAGTTLIACCMGTMFAGGCLVSILLTVPPVASAATPAASSNIHGVVEAGTMATPEQKL